TTMGMMFVAIGLLFSAMTRNQIVSAIWTFAVMLFLIVMVPLVYLQGAQRRAGWAEAVRFTSVVDQVRAFGMGQLDLRHLVLHLSACVLVLSLTVRILEVRSNR